MAKSKGSTSLKAHVLLDGGNLHGSFFHRSVLLICDHTPEGAMGLVLNRPSENQLQQVFTQPLPARLQEERLYSGGPVQPASLSYLHSDSLLLNANVMPNLSVGHDLDELIGLGDSWSPSQKVRVFAGYAGWSAGQLDEEMRRSAWIAIPATLELVFHAPPEELWKHILRKRRRWQERLLAEAPDDLSSN